MAQFQSIQALDQAALEGRKVLVRVDFNVPIKNGVIGNDQRMRASLPTIHYLLERGAQVLLMSHLGRPDGQVVDKYRLKPIGEHLQTLLGQPVLVLNDCIGAATQTAIAQASERVILLENTRFYAQETDNQPTFAQALAALGDLYVNDAFGTAHRAHASTAGVAAYLPAYAGLLMTKEIEALSGVLESPAHPFVAIIGGAKVSTKLAVLNHLLPKVDTLVIGGAMAFTFWAAQGHPVGKSLIEPDLLDTAAHLLHQAEQTKTQIILPVDVAVADSPDATASNGLLTPEATPEEWGQQMGLDVGPATLQRIESVLANAKTVLWNGPLGVFENPAFAQATFQIARLLAAKTATGCVTVVGGGDSVAAIEKTGLQDQFSHISTGGGASLEFLEGIELPGIAVLKKENL